MSGRREMTGTLSLAGLEMKRVLRNRLYLIFTLAFPIMLYLVVAKQAHGAHVYGGVPFAAYYMVAMAAWGAFSGSLTGTAQRISQERKDGWVRQLRLTSLPASGYVIAKVLASLVTTVPSVVIVLALGHFYGGVQLAAWKFIVIGAAVWLGAMTFAALAVALGYRFLPDRVQPIAMVVYFGMAILGGLWFPLGGILQTIGKVLPTYQITRIGTDVLTGGGVSATRVLVILAWLTGFVVLAAFAVRGTAERV